MRDDPDELDNRFDHPDYRDRQSQLPAEITRFLIRYPRPPYRGRNRFFG